MILYLILGSFVLYLLIDYIGIVIVAGIIVGILYWLDSKDKSVEKKQESSEIKEDPHAKAVYKEFYQDGVIDWDGYNKSKVEKMMKPGFKDDPEWQAKSAAIKAHMNQQKVQNVREETEAINEELNINEPNFWQKVR